ncbi:hypothetical protein H257_19054 [Aphanomyces astaci]|uniref:Cationic amino acid transporter C-terminal domain-containing protein n=1 Tax=Aphanomyces astaci TaxID=112090 RepID=W4FB21_APHAT|nr:hypothetical protein H257_19054 [Aphanomyces astaci]ETV64011.1 hypothetical protein H257_19054 [Aphanomyces astaci]|eukprot:XP_009846505.1 hypothetical protein H257_19054 [Aphanomyces astaci]
MLQLRKKGGGKMDVNATDGERGNVQAAGGGPMTSLWSRVSWKKPLSLTYAEESSENPHLERTLGCFDLLMIGIGGTVGSGVFATAGLIAKSYAGPAAVLSWILAGFGCILSGASFMELSGLIPSAGSTYAYAYHSLGEMPAMIAGCLLTLEYGVASAGSARSWSDKFQSWLRQMGVEGPVWMKPKDSSIDLYAGLLMSLCVGIVLCGMSAGKQLINVVTVTKISVVLFIIVVGLTKFDSSNMDPFIAPEHINAVDQVVFGWPGVMLGASASFYGYIGYDEVCCLAAEAKNPTRDIPRAVFGTVVGAAFLSTLATLSLVGMQKYTEIDVAESYGTALRHVGYHWAAPIVEIGEVFTMPVGILIGFLAQPRVQYAMSKDGLLPACFSSLDKHGNPFYGTLIAGFGLIGIAVCIPFKYLWDFISLGILLAFNLTNTCLLAVRYKSCLYTPACINSASNPTAAVVALFLGVSWLSAYHIQESLLAPRGSTDHWYMHTYGPVAAAVFSVASGLCVAVLAHANHPIQLVPKQSPDNDDDDEPTSPSVETTASIDEEDHEDDDVAKKQHPHQATPFHAPFVPVFPCLAIWFNWFLAVQIPLMIVSIMALYVAVACGVYGLYGLRGRHSLSSQHLGGQYAIVPESP